MPIWVPAPAIPPSSTAGHRRSWSDITFGFAQLSPPLPMPALVKREVTSAAEGCRSNGNDVAALYDLVNAMDLDALDLLDSSNERHDDRDSHACQRRKSKTSRLQEGTRSLELDTI
jgi:hypothetical protein